MMKIIAGILLSCFALTSQAKLIHYSKSTETVRVAYGGPTIFRFPSEVRTISQSSIFDIKPANTDDPDYSVLSVTPRFANGSGLVTFILSDESVVRTNVVVSENAKDQTIYDFQDNATLLAQGISGKGGPPVSAMDLLRAMIRDDLVSGYKYKKISNNSAHVGQALIELVRIYEGDQFNGYVFKIKNEDKKNDYLIDIRKLSVGRPNLAVLSQVDQSVLGPKKSDPGLEPIETTLRVVTKSTALLTDIVLPLSTIPTKESK